MKTTFLTLLFLIPLFCFAQIPKKANTIIITGNLTQDESFKQVTGILFESGYGILSSDNNIGTITTTEKSIKRATTRFTFLIKDKKVLIRGQFNINITTNYGGVSSPSDWSDIQYFGMNGSPSMAAWNEMLKIAEMISGKKEYLIK